MSWRDIDLEKGSTQDKIDRLKIRKELKLEEAEKEKGIFKEMALETEATEIDFKIKELERRKF